MKNLLTKTLFVALLLSAASSVVKADFCKTIKSGNVVEIKQGLELGTEVHERDKHGNTTLVFATGYGRLQLAKLLLEQEDKNGNIAADLVVAHGRDKDGNIALVFAIDYDCSKLIKLLLEQRVSVEFSLEPGAEVELSLEEEAEITFSIEENVQN